MNNIAIYAGSFDPLTNGHLNVIEKAMGLFDTIVIAIGDNPKKKSHFTYAERLDMIDESVLGLKMKLNSKCRIRCDIFRSQFLVDYAKEINATHLIRGIRNTTDFEMEKEMFYFNKNMDKSIETIFIMPDKDVEHLSSSLIRGMVGYVNWKKNVRPNVPNITLRYLEQQNFKYRFEKTISKIEKLGNNFKYEKNAVLSQMLDKYDTIKRPYHNINHITNMLELSDSIFLDTEIDRTLLEYAIFFHDFIDESELGNVAIEKSAKAAKQFVDFDLDNKYIKIIDELIMATNYENRFGPNKQPIAFTKLQKIMMDLDFYEMGQDYSHFANNTELIRKEYSQVTDDEFSDGRRKFLLNICHERIFLSDEFLQLETIAHKNINIELTEIENAITLF